MRIKGRDGAGSICPRLGPGTRDVRLGGVQAWPWDAMYAEEEGKHMPGSGPSGGQGGLGHARRYGHPPHTMAWNRFDSPGGNLMAPDHAAKLETDLDDENAIPYFLEDSPMTVAELRRQLRTASQPERNQLLGKVLREARTPDVWRFTTPEEVDARFDALAPHLGRRRKFWEFLLGCWREQGLLGQQST